MSGVEGWGRWSLPAREPRTSTSAAVHVDALVALASRILTHRTTWRTSLGGPKADSGLREILRVGTSAGGARAKAVIAWNRKTNEVRSGQVEVGDGFEYWLLKFDGVSGNRDKDLDDPKGSAPSSLRTHRWLGLPVSECPNAACWRRTGGAIS